MSKIQKITFRGETTNLLKQSQIVNSESQKAQDNAKIIASQNEIIAPKISANPEKVSLQNAQNLAYVGSALAIISLGISGAVALKRGKKSGVTEIINQSKKQAHDIVDPAMQNMKSELNRGITDITQRLGDLSNKVSDTSKWHDNWINTVEKRLEDNAKWQEGWLKNVEQSAKDALNKSSSVVVGGFERRLRPIDGLNLLQNLENDGSRINLPPKVIEKLKTVANKYIYTQQPIPKLNRNSTIWSLTSESIPEKEGGLGEVPVQIAKNMSKVLGIDNYLVRPLNEIPGKSKIVSKNDKYMYYYDLDKDKPFKLEVKKIMEFSVPSFRNGRFETQPVEVFYGEDPQGFKRLMFKNETYFKSNGMYKESQSASEVERYAFFTRVVYDFMKIKADPKAGTSFNISNLAIYENIKTPDAMILNDWHAAAMAGLTKLKAPMEGAMGELSKKTAKIFEEMNLVNIIHNADYQGSSWKHSSEILNTLYDKYAADAYEFTNSGFLNNGIQKVLTVEGGSNLANIGACLANKVKPVSPTYAFELSSDVNRGHALQHVFSERLKAGTMVGASNGWDRAVNEISIEKLSGFNKNINNDKLTIFKNNVSNIEGLTVTQQKEIDEVLSKGMSPEDYEMNINKLKEFSIPKLDALIAEMEEKGITKLRSFKPYTNTNNIEDIMKARKHNKRMFIEYLNSMVEYNKKHSDLFNIAEFNLTDLSHINLDDLDDTPVFNMGVRFVSQKGVDIAAESIKGVLQYWESKYPGKKKPIFVIGGKDDEGGRIRQIALDFKRSLGENGKQIVYMDGYTPNNIFQGGSDFSLYPSHFEPDGAKWESLYKGTPVVCTRVGGQVDSVKDGINGFLSERTVPEVGMSGFDYLGTMAHDFKEAIFRASDTFFDKKAYKYMVRNAIDGDQSWLIKDADGKITGGALLGHLKDLGFDLKDFPEIQLPQVV